MKLVEHLGGVCGVASLAFRNLIAPRRWMLQLALFNHFLMILNMQRTLLMQQNRGLVIWDVCATDHTIVLLRLIVLVPVVLLGQFFRIHYYN
jgi:hypothetical protein